MDNPFQQITLYLLFIRGPKVDDWVEGRHNQLQRTVLGDPTNGIPPALVAERDRRLQLVRDELRPTPTARIRRHHCQVLETAGEEVFGDDAMRREMVGGDVEK